MVWLQERIHSWKIWKTKDTFIKPEGSPVLQLHLPLTTTYQCFLWSLFKGVLWEEVNPGSCSLTVSLRVKLSVVYFPFIVFGSIFSEGSEDCWETEPLSHTKHCLKQSQIQYKCNMASLTCGGCPVRLPAGCLASDAQLPMTLSFLVPHSAQLELNP